MRLLKKGKKLLDELAESALARRFLFDGVREYEKPGQIIESQTPEVRAELAKLTSDDLQNVRWPRPDGINLEKMPRKLR